MFMFYLIFVLIIPQVRVDCSTNSSKSLALFGIKEQVRISYLSKVRNLHTAYTFSLSSKGYNWGDVIFYCVWVGFLLFIAYNILKPCFRRNNWGFARRSRSGSRPGGGGGGGGWFPGDYRRPDPPYVKNPSDNGVGGGWMPGFWSGAALGGLVTQYWNNQRRNEPAAYWNQWNQIPLQNPGPSMFRSSRQPAQFNDNDLGQMRSSTGIGGSNVR